jgi:Tfp pilus assembly protein PilF
MEKPSAPAARQSGKEYRREIIILALVIIVTAVAYNVIAPLMKPSKPKPAVSGAAVTSFQTAVQAGNSLMDQGMYDQAIPKYEEALSLDSLHPEILVDLGACYHAIGENEKASFNFHRALALDPKHPVALFNLGVVGMTVGDTASARSWWTKYLAVATDSQQIQMVRDQLGKL